MKNILIVVDMQNGFCTSKRINVLKENIIKITNNNIFDCIIATKFINGRKSPFVKFMNWNKLKESPEIDLIDNLKVDYIVNKYETYTCVYDDFLDLLKQINDRKIPAYVFLCGVDTDCCVLKIATDLFENNIMPLTLIKYCDSTGGEESHIAGQKVLKRLIGKKCLIDSKVNSKEDIQNILKQIEK